MKKRMYFLLSALLMLGVSGTLHAQVWARAQQVQQQVKADKQGKFRKLKDVLFELKKKHQVDILYFGKNIEEYQVPAEHYDPSQTLEQNLNRLLSPLNLTFKKSGKGGYIISSKTASRSTSSTSESKTTLPGTEKNEVINQSESVIAERTVAASTIKNVAELNISGKVVDQENNAPLPGVSILIKGMQRGTTTNSEGAYTLTVPDENAVLIFSFVGYTAEERTVGNQQVINVSLQTDTKALGELVVVGYGTQRKKDLTGSVVRIDPKLNATNPNVNVSQSLRGSVAGVTVIDTGRPGADGTISIRGNASISASNAPLIILDGIIYTGGLSDINSNDIESIDILKDASSASIYGSRATNGVILITTKKGTSAQPRLTYNAYYGMSDFANTPKMMGPERYLQMKEDAADFLGRPLILNPIEEANRAAGRTIDPWLAIAQDAPMYNHELSLSGRTERVNYYVSGSYTNMKGRVMGDNFSRFSSRLNLDITLTDWLSIGTNTGFTIKDYSGIRANFETASYLSPYSSLYYDDGELKSLPMDDGIAPNPIFNTVRNDHLSLSNTLFNNAYMDIKLPIPGLTYRLNMGNNLRFNEDANFTPSINEPRDNNFRLANGSKATRKHHYLTVENIVKYNKNFGENHAFDLTLLQSFERTKESGSSLSSNNIFSDVLSYNGLGIGENQLISTTATQSQATSYMGRVGYRLLDKYLFNFTIRRDGYSAFGSGRKFGNFPSVGLGWMVSDEKFMSDISWVNYLKVRYSYGKNGNRGINPYSSLSNMTQSGNQYVFGDNGVTSIGITPTSMANRLLGWETTVASNYGLDFSLFQNKVSGSVEYYSMNTSDLLLDLRIPNMTGYEIFFTNIGATSNRGVEVTLNTTNYTHQKFSWTSNFVFTLNRNKITSLSGNDLNGDGIEDDDIASNRFIGHPQGTNFNYVWDGIWQEGEENVIDPSAKPGYVKFKDINGDGKIGPEDRQVLHSSQPDFSTGLTNRLAYGGFSLSVFLNARIGGYSGNSLLNHGNNFFDRVNLMDLPYWTPENPLTDRPSIGYPNLLGYGFYQSRTFVRLQDVSLAYELPESLLKKTRLNQLKVYVSGKNLHTWTGWDGWDPEHGSGGRNVTNGPLMRSWVVGISLGL
ncbi:SusC/RagA family TonB-linked outer membrane protein [Arundinibacter roseus]|uniref:TonB-dependent receptor n=1 Tax=Arundinibacter roseus TaxID=2070510 RepID=A0A4R4KN27_9BACT|nr:TonB-dependent receptor [Arundinibacter roseus]TDB67951.1 TonB-dependent receptor [Arundinibacter roseus]